MVSKAVPLLLNRRTNIIHGFINYDRLLWAVNLEDFKMRLYDLQKVWDSDVVKWLEDSIPELTAYQKEEIRNKEIVRFAPFYFMKRTKKVNNILTRFSVIFLLPVLILLIIGLPINFFITGKWGYSERMRWYGKWVSACGL